MSDHHQTVTYTIAERGAAIMGYSGAGTMGLFGLSDGEWQALGVLGGIFFALCGFAISAYFGYRRDRREERESLDRLRRQCGTRS